MNYEKICEVCGCVDREPTYKGGKLGCKKVQRRVKFNQVLCEKHYRQILHYGKFLDNNKYTVWDINEIYIKDDIGHLVIRNNTGEIIAEALIDIDDIEKIKTLKWRITNKRNKNYVIGGDKHNNISNIYLARFIMNCTDTDLIVDHISGDELDNRKANLRFTTKGDNARNVRAKCISKSGIRGVSYDNKHKLWKVDFSCRGKRYYPTSRKTKEEAVYLRYLFEINFLKEFRYTSNDELYFEEINKLTPTQKEEIEKYFNKYL